MTWPKKYGGHERTHLERYVVLEELLSAGAPVGAHWIADRQSGPLLMRFGTQAQRDAYLPRIARGELFFCIGMSRRIRAPISRACAHAPSARTKAGASTARNWTSGAQLRR